MTTTQPRQDSILDTNFVVTIICAVLSGIHSVCVPDTIRRHVAARRADAQRTIKHAGLPQACASQRYMRALSKSAERVDELTNYSLIATLVRVAPLFEAFANEHDQSGTSVARQRACIEGMDVHLGRIVAVAEELYMRDLTDVLGNLNPIFFGGR